MSITDLILCLVACGLGGKERIPSAVGEKMLIVHRASKAEQRVPRGLGNQERAHGALLFLNDSQEGTIRIAFVGIGGENRQGY